MSMSEPQQYARQIKYQKEKCQRVYLNFVTTTDADILEHLEKQPNRQGYIKALIRADIAKSSQGK